MIHRGCFHRLILIGLAVWPGLSLPRAESPTSLPSAEDVIARVVERAKKKNERNLSDDYACTKLSVREELDAKGKVKDREEKISEVAWLGGIPRARLVKVNGRTLSDQERKQEAEREKKARREFSEAKPGEEDEKQENHSLTELLARFVFTTERRESLNGRKTLVLSFRPKHQELPSGKITDRVLNRLAGTVWVDEEEAEFVKVDVHLGERVTLWGGLLGALENFRLSLAWIRVADGVWLHQSATTLIEGRKVLSPMRYRITDQSTNFHRVSPNSFQPSPEVRSGQPAGKPRGGSAGK
jgi:hypothetical protein